MMFHGSNIYVGNMSMRGATSVTPTGGRNTIVANGDAQLDGNGALVLGGSGHLSIADNNWLDPDSGAMTWEFYIKTTQTSRAEILEKYQASPDRGWYIAINSVATGKVTFAIDDNAGNWRGYNSTTSVNDGSWHHVRVSWSGGTNVVKISVDGTEGQTQYISSGTVGSVSTVHDLLIGKDPDDAGREFIGNLSRMVIYKGVVKDSTFTPPARTDNIVIDSTVVLAPDLTGPNGSTTIPDLAWAE